MSKDKCLSCGFDVDVEGKDLCWYCYSVRNRGASRFILFLSLLDHGNRFVTIDEALIIANKYRDLIKKPHTTRRAIYQILCRYSKYYNSTSKGNHRHLILTRKTSYQKLNPKHSKTRTTGACNATMYKYKLSARLVKRAKRHLKRWKFGLPVYEKKLLLNSEEKNKAHKIKNKIDSGEYDLFEYILV